MPQCCLKTRSASAVRAPKSWGLSSPPSSTSVPRPSTPSCSSQGGLRNSTALCPTCQHTAEGLLSIQGALPGRGGMERLMRDTLRWGLEAPVAMPSTAPASTPTPVCPEMPRPTPRGPISSSVTPLPSSPPVCRAAHRGSKPCLGEGSVQGAGCFSEGVCGAGPAQRGYHSPQQTGPAAVCYAGTSWACRTQKKAKAGGEQPTANTGASGGFPHPPIWQPSPPWAHVAPQSEAFAVSPLRRWRPPCQGMAALPAW